MKPDINKQTTSFYDGEHRLIERRTVNSETSIRETYEYDPDGELCHIRTEISTLRYFKGFRQLPSGNFDTSRIEERVAVVPSGEVYDQWFSWEQDGAVMRTELVIRTGNGNMAKFFL
jgi:hypothetical protein